MELHFAAWYLCKRLVRNLLLLTSGFHFSVTHLLSTWWWEISEKQKLPCHSAQGIEGHSVLTARSLTLTFLFKALLQLVPKCLAVSTAKLQSRDKSLLSSLCLSCLEPSCKGCLI